MGRRAVALQRLLASSGVDVLGEAPSFVPSALPSGRLDTARRIFGALGGEADRFPERGPGRWDLVTAEGLVVELDEEQHFNRYRAATLAVLTDAALPWSSSYAGYCAGMERRCTARRGWWTNPSSERVFGPSDPEGVFAAHGSARWKQRAFNDALKDLAPDVRLARISIYDVIEGRTVDSILKTSDDAWATRVRVFIEDRITT